MGAAKRTPAEESRWVTHNAMCPRDDPAAIVRYAFQEAADECTSIDIVPIDDGGRLTYPALEPVLPGFAPESIIDYIVNDPRGGQGVYRLNLKDATGKTGIARGINVFLDRAAAGSVRARMPLGRSLHNTREALEETVAIGRATKFLRSLESEEEVAGVAGQAEAMKAMAEGFSSIIKMQGDLVRERATPDGSQGTALLDLYKTRVEALERKLDEVGKTAPPSVLAEISKARELLTGLGLNVAAPGATAAAPASIWDDPTKLSGFIGIGKEILGEVRSLVHDAIATYRGGAAPPAPAAASAAIPDTSTAREERAGGRRGGAQDKELVSMALEALRSGDWPTVRFLLAPPNGAVLIDIDPDPALPPERKPWPNPVVYRPLLVQLDEIFGLAPAAGFAAAYPQFVEFVGWYRRLVSGQPLETRSAPSAAPAPVASVDPPPPKCGPRRADVSGASRFCSLAPHTGEVHAELVGEGLVEFREVRG